MAEQAYSHLGGVSYALGERRRHYLDIEHFSEIAARYEMIEDARLWGWGSFWQSQSPVIELMLQAGRRALQSSGLAAGEIDTLILCATEFPAGIDAHAAYYRRCVQALGLREDLVLFGVTLNRCATMLSAISLAHELVNGGQRRAVLILSGDKIDRECDRFQKFALFSDGASACVVAAEPMHGYSILGTASAIDAAGMDADGEISANLARRVSERLLAQAKIGHADIKTVFHNNLFLPIVKMKEQQAGFAARQLFLENIASKGHCFGSDPLINLADHAAKGSARPGDYLVLVSSVPGIRVAIVLRQT